MLFVAMATCVASIVATKCDGKDGACQIGTTQLLQVHQTHVVNELSKCKPHFCEKDSDCPSTEYKCMSQDEIFVPPPDDNGEELPPPDDNGEELFVCVTKDKYGYVVAKADPECQDGQDGPPPTEMAGDIPPPETASGGDGASPPETDENVNEDAPASAENTNSGGDGASSPETDENDAPASDENTNIEEDEDMTKPETGRQNGGRRERKNNGKKKRGGK